MEAGLRVAAPRTAPDPAFAQSYRVEVHPVDIDGPTLPKRSHLKPSAQEAPARFRTRNSAHAGSAMLPVVLKQIMASDHRNKGYRKAICGQRVLSEP
jgi:hypothetical protein